MKGFVNGKAYPTPPGKLSEDDLANVTGLVVERINDLVDLLTVDQWAEGMTWYKDANDFAWSAAVDRGMDGVAACWALALLSPLNNWDQNKADLLQLMDEGTCGALPLGVERARAVLSGADGGLIAGGRKVRSFGWNILYPYNSLDVTIDTHMVNVLDLPARAYVDRRGVYDAIADGFRKVAVEHGVLPHQLQAAIWLYQR